MTQLDMWQKGHSVYKSLCHVSPFVLNRWSKKNKGTGKPRFIGKMTIEMKVMVDTTSM